ncbi:hypothetical protein [Curtobacterium sp. RRHDQ10]|uniref:hypothetical protein n=1 Tax=Curtobacterium phyllosphaerae TaxID=3413379 RepID=UPI003BF0A11F
MITTTQPSYAPRTRAGLLISCVGFAALAASAVIPILADALGPVMGVGFAVAVVVIVYVPRLIRPGSTWWRAPLPRVFATMVSIGAAVAALIAVAVRTSGGSLVWGYVATAVVVLGMVLVASAAPEEVHRQRR